MDLAAIITAGSAGTLLIVVGWLLHANRADRRQYEEAIDRAEQRADDAEQRTAVVRAENEVLRERAFACEEERIRLRAQLSESHRQRDDRHLDGRQP